MNPITAPALGHDWSAWNYRWEGVGDGTYHHRTCQRNGCGATEAETHHLDWYDNSTPGFHSLVCRVCSRGGYAYRRESHSFDNWKDNRDGTCTGTCACGRQKTKDHDFSVDVPAKDATCTEPGYTAHKACSRCGAKDAAYSAISAGHDWVTGPAVPATCTEPGLTEGKHCTRCTEKVEQEPVPALGHEYRETDRDILRIYYRCDRCKGHSWWDNYRDENRVPGLLLDEAGTELSYASAVTRSGGNMLLTLTPEAAEGGVSLTLTVQDLAEWQKLGLTQIALVLGDGRLVMDATQIGPGWFGDLEAADAYLFTLTPTKEGLQIRVEALMGEARTEALALIGLTLERGEQAVEITENGEYTSAA